MCNIETICRLCGASEGIKVNVFDPKRTYVSTIHQILPIMVDERDPWSKLICHRCAFKLDEFYNFRELCVRTDAYLKTQVSWVQPRISQHIPAEPSQQNEHIKREQIEEEKRDEPSSAPPPLSPQIKQESQDVFSTGPPPLSPAPCTQVQANNLQHISVTQDPLSEHDPLSDTIFVNYGLSNDYLAEEPEAADSDSISDDNAVGFPDSGVSEEMGVDAKTETSRTESRKHKNTSSSVQMSKKRKMPLKHRSRSHHTNKINSVKSVLVRTEDGRKNGTESNKFEPKHHVRTKAANMNENMLNLRSHANAGTLKKKLTRKPGPKSKVGSRDDDSESDESDVVFVLHKPAGSALDEIDMTNVSDSPEEEVDESDPEEGLLPHAVLTRIPGICSVYTCTCCEGTFTSKRCVNNHVCKSKENNSSPPGEQIPRRETSEDMTSRKETCKDVVPEAMASENGASVEKTSDNSVHDNEVDRSRGSTSKSTLSSSFVPFSGLPRKSYLRRGAATIDKDGSNQDMVTPNGESYKCDICGFTFSRLVTLLSHKSGHLYRMNDDDDDDDDEEEEEEEEEDDDEEEEEEEEKEEDDYRCIRKKKKPVAKTVKEES